MDSLHFYLALFFHLVFLILGFGSVMVIDTFGLLMLLKKTTLVMVEKVANITQKLIWVGWTGMVISGFNLIILKGYVDNLTKIKIFLVLLIGLNGWFLHKIKQTLKQHAQFSDIPNKIKFNIFFSTLISQIGWWGALVIGFVHRHIKHNIVYPENPYLWIINLLLGLACIFILGRMVFKK